MKATKASVETSARRSAFLSRLAAFGYDAVVLDNQDDLFYFTGYTGSDAVAVLSVKSGKGWIISDSRYLEEMEKSAPDLEAQIWKSGFAGFVGKLLKKLRAKAVAYTPGAMTAAFWLGMKAEAPGVADWQDAWPEIAALRAVKSRKEIAAMRAALDCAQKAFLTAKERWKIGMTETDVKNDLEWEMRRFGAQDASFETIVAVGANASLPHAHAEKRKLQAGKMLLIDFGARVDRYCSDLTRTMWPGAIPPVWKKRYQAVLEAQLAGIAEVKAGVGGDAPYKAAVKVLAKYRIDDKFTHSLGHGIGLAVHEFPRLAGFNPKPLVAGNIVTAEPGVYFPGSGGIRTEDMLLVTENGCEVMSSLPKMVEDAVI